MRYLYDVLVHYYPSCEEKWASFELIIHLAIDILLPVKNVKKCTNEPPWMTHHLKSLVRQRQKALASGNHQLFKNLRNSVNCERKQCRSKFFDTNVKQLRISNPKQWRKSVKSLCGMDPVTRTNNLRHLLNPSSDEHAQRESLTFTSCQ